ncbi:MAG TPA: EMC3/TMCO1 family protein [Bacteroidales bacterium]|nr:EMC3/TMCO1 family protein [Bacteroidales bacterium]
MEAFIFLAQTKALAAIEIIIMLVVAAVIGYLTSWMYYKFIYTKKINALEKEMEDLKARIVRLNADKGDLEKQVGKLEADLARLQKKNKEKPQAK